MRGITKRQKEILTRIADSTGYISPKELANKLEVSTRTIRNDISEINSYNDVQIICMVKAKGYYIKEQEIAKKLVGEYSNDIPSTVEERTSYIINKLLYRMDSIDIFDLADELMVSEYTIEKDLGRVKLLFRYENNNIEMKRVNNKIFLEASEREKRSLLCKLILKEQKDNVFDIDSYEKNFKNIDVKEINNILRNYFSEHNIRMNDLAIINLVIHILIVLEKVRNKFDIKDDNNYLNMLNNEDIEISNDICERIESLLNIDIPKKEKEYIALLISGKRMFIHNRSEKKKSNEKVTSFVDYIVDKLKKEYLLDLKEDLEFISGLTLHMENLLIRSKKGIFIQNPLIYTIKKVYPLIYDMGVTVALEYKETFNYALNDDEIGLIVLHLASSIEKLNEKNSKIRCLVICPTGVSSSNLLKNRLIKMYSDKINVIGCLSIQQLKDVREESVDIIISTVPIETKLRVKLIECSPFLLKDDINRLNKALNLLVNKEECGEISKLFDKELFYKDIELEDRMEVIEYLVERLHKKGYCSKNYVEYILKRERVSSTAYGGLIAIPHPLEKVAYKNKIEIGVLKEPIMWGKYKVQVVFLFCLNSDKNLNLDAFFEKLISVVENQEVIKKLINSKSYEEFVEAFTADYI